MSRKTICSFAAVFIFLPLFSSRAQDPSSRLIPFTLSTSLPPSTTQEVEVELWDASSGGALIFAEAYTGPNALSVDDGGNISFLFGSLQTPPGLDPCEALVFIGPLSGDRCARAGCPTGRSRSALNRQTLSRR